jgi:glutamate-1-semialdehyde 2,1-aminomutase
MSVLVIVQARMGSTRLPNKVMKPLAGRPLIEFLLGRVALCKKVDKIIVATSTNSNNKPLLDHVSQLGYSCELGSENDVLDRFAQAAKKYEAETIVRITGDCPLLDPEIIDACITRYMQSGVDYCSNIAPATFPDGMDVEVFSSNALERAANEAISAFDREHVTPYIRSSGLFSTVNLENSVDLSVLRLTVDEPEDLALVAAISANFSPDSSFSLQQIIDFLEENPELVSKNSRFMRNAGAINGTGQKLWQRAKKIIPGGNLLLSKRAEMFLPGLWPAYFHKAKGCRVWDLDNREYIDMSIMGVGTNILGYGHEEVDEVVRQTVDLGNMSTLNCAEEVYLAEKLVDMHSWADMAHFSRTGGEANAVAIRIARAVSGRYKVAFCGYHGWHDWYLSANLANGKGLDGHLLPGLAPRGVPETLANTVFPFAYNDFEGLQSLVAKHDIGVIKMEVVRNKGPDNNFLEKVRELATEKNIILIFDECTSGFRETFGGIHKKFNVVPDMAVFGKALGNGYSITGTLGRREIMELAQETFISSTFWTERLGPAAALKTLEIMEREKSWVVITETGNKIKQGWASLAEKHSLPVSQWGLPALAGFTIESEDAMAYKTYITQELLAKGILASNVFYASTAHTDSELDQYFEALDPVFATISECEQGRDIKYLLQTPVCQSGFKRLN